MKRFKRTIPEQVNPFKSNEEYQKAWLETMHSYFKSLLGEEKFNKVLDRINKKK